ncbi:MAG TPA: trigger factor [Planctomycetota bacterium]|nr:trigger factor [Planctomycetota bacterium]
MQVTVEKLGPCQARVSFTVPSQEFQGALKKALGEAGRNVRMKGFRPGHVPAQVIERQFGKEIRRGTIEDFVRKAFQQAVEENKLKVVGNPSVDLESLLPLEGADLSHQFEISLRPEIVLDTYKGLAIESELEPVLDQEVEAAVDNLKVQQAHPEPAGDAGLPTDGLALVKVEWLVGAESILSRDGLRISPEAPTPGCDPEAFKKALVGAKDGDVREIAMTIPEDFEREDLRGKAGVTRITVTQAYRMVPPTDDEVLRLLSATDAADLKVKVKEKIEEAKIEREQARIETTLLGKLIDSHTFELPEALVVQQTEGRLLELARELEAAGTPKDKIPEQAEAQRESAKTAAARGLRALFLVQTIAEKENLLVSREDLKAELEAIAARNQATVEEVGEYYKKQNLFDQMAIEILERKVRKFLRENAQITEPK